MAAVTRPCPRCEGTGKLLDTAATGARLRREREQRGVSMRAVARTLGYSVPYLSDLERGYRPWRRDLVRRYERALKAQP